MQHVVKLLVQSTALTYDITLGDSCHFTADDKCLANFVDLDFLDYIFFFNPNELYSLMSVLHKMSTYPQSIPLGPLSHTCHLSMFILCGVVRGFILRLSQTVLKHRNSIRIRLYR